MKTFVFYDYSRLKTLIVIPSVFKGKHIKKVVNIFREKEIVVNFDRPAVLQVYGYTVSEVTEYRVNICKNRKSSNRMNKKEAVIYK